MGRKVRDIFYQVLQIRYLREVRHLNVTFPVSLLMPVFALIIKIITLLVRYKSMDL